MFMIHLICRPSKGVKFLSQNRRTLTIVLPILCICALFWFMISFSAFIHRTISFASVRAGDTLTRFPIKSTGCGKPSLVAPGTSTHQTIFSGGISRSYLVHIPREYRDTTAQALILNFHGHGSSALQQESRTGFSSFADTYDIIVAYPQGVVGPDHQTGWNTGPLRNPSTNDVLYVSDLLNHLQATWCINPHRIYAAGFSNGGGMTNVLACKLAGRIAAFATVAGAYPAVPGGCHPIRPVPFIELHGTSDSIVPYGGSLIKGYPPVPLWLWQWAERDGCASDPAIFFHQANVTGERWMGCRDHVTIIHYLIDNMEHTWPRRIIVRYQGQTTTLYTAKLIWAFFQSYPLPVVLTR